MKTCYSINLHQSICLKFCLNQQRFEVQVIGKYFNTTVINNITDGREFEIDGLQPASQYPLLNLFQTKLYIFDIANVQY